MVYARDDLTISVVIPAYNEERTIGEVVDKIRRALKVEEIIVVDDGSGDATAEQALATGAKVVRNTYNIGNGASVRRGAAAAKGDVVVFMDADGQHPPEELPKLIEWIGDYDMVVGTRSFRVNASFGRAVGNAILVWVARQISGRKIVDLTSGFRVIKREHLLEHLHLFPNRYSYPTTLTLAMMMGGRFVRFEQVPKISPRAHDKSNIQPIRDFVRFLAIILRIIIMFNPQRFFVPLGGVLFLFGVAISALQVWYTGGIQGTGLALLLASVNIACFGFLADQVAFLRRQRRN